MGAEGSNTSNVPPPFLTKTYDMVDDPATDEIVSWGDNNSSFVVWNVADFAKDLLPQYFKHNNFSSFVRQLNTYGFHKIDPDRWEFANEGFSKGNKESLKNIHRRKPSASHTHIPQHLELPNEHSCTDLAHVELQEEIKKLKHDKSLLVMELWKLRQQQQTTDTELQTLGQRLESLEERQQQMVAFLARAMQNPGSFMQLVQQTESCMHLAFSKKRRLPDREVLVGVGESGGDDGGQLVRYYPGDDDVISDIHLTDAEVVSRAEVSFEGILSQLAISSLNQSAGGDTSPLSRSSGVTLPEMHSAHPDPSANDTPAQSVTMSQSGAAECSDHSYQKRETGDFKAGSTAPHINSSDEVEIGVTGVQDLQPSHEKANYIMIKACGSNDIFWENLLTENPRLTEKEADETEGDDHPCERWFF